jgi:hypothetical protein
VFLKETFVVRAGGSLRNFGFCVLSPDGEKKLRKSNRGPNFLYANPGKMAADLRQVAKQYAGATPAKGTIPSVPQMKSVRLGINVASCDGLPCVVVVGRDQAEVDRLNDKLSGVIWDKALVGKFICASTTNRDDLGIVTGVTSKSGFLVIKPDVYGKKGELIKAIDGDASSKELKKSLASIADKFARNSKTHGTHVRDGRRNGETWETEVPVPERDRSRNRGSK